MLAFFAASEAESLVISLASVNRTRSTEIRKNRFLEFSFSFMPIRPPVTLTHLLICSKALSGPITQFTTQLPLLNSDHISE